MHSPPKAGAWKERAILLALAVAFATIGAIWVPQLFLITPAPLAAMVYRHGSFAGIAAAILVAILVGMMIGLFWGIFALLVIGLMGVALGEALREGFPPIGTLAVAAGVLLFSLALMHTLGRILFEKDLALMPFDYWARAIDQVVAVWQKAGVHPEQIAVRRESLQSMMRVARLIFPAMLPIGAIMVGFVDYWGAKQLVGRLGGRVRWFPPFSRWRLPWYLAWGYIVGQGALLLGRYFASDAATAIGANLTSLFSLLFLILGFSVLWFWGDRFRIHWLVRALVVILILQPQLPFGLFLVWLGVLDAWLNFRRI